MGSMRGIIWRRSSGSAQMRGAIPTAICPGITSPITGKEKKPKRERPENRAWEVFAREAQTLPAPASRCKAKQKVVAPRANVELRLEFWAPAKPALGKPAGDEPEAMPVVTKKFERGSTPVAKDEESPGERVFLQRPLTQRGQAIDSVAKINRLTSEPDSELWDELNHRLPPRRKSWQICLVEWRSRAGSVMVRREPSGRSSWRRESVGSQMGDGGAGEAASTGKWKNASCDFLRAVSRAGFSLAALLSRHGSVFSTRRTREGGNRRLILRVARRSSKGIGSRTYWRVLRHWSKRVLSSSNSTGIVGSIIASGYWDSIPEGRVGKFGRKFTPRRRRDTVNCITLLP